MPPHVIEIRPGTARPARRRCRRACAHACGRARRRRRAPPSRAGETEIDSISAVEDTKGNNGDKGSLLITNLRLIWRSSRAAKTNLSIGYNCVVAINVKSASSRLRGNTQALYVMTKYQETKFEFIFTNLIRGSPRLFTTVQVRALARARPLRRPLARRSVGAHTQPPARASRRRCSARTTRPSSTASSSSARRSSRTSCWCCCPRRPSTTRQADRPRARRPARAPNSPPCAHLLARLVEMRSRG